MYRDSPEDAEIFFIVYGSLEYLDVYGDTIIMEDWRSVANRYYEYCKENEIEYFDLTHPRSKSNDLVWKEKPKVENENMCKP